MTLLHLGWLFTCGVLLHNTEEAIWLPQWSADVGRLSRPVTAPQFRLAAVAVSAIFVAITASASLSAAGGPSAYIMAGYVLAMVLTVFFPHVLATLLKRRYMPGTASAVLLNLPVGIVYLRTGQHHHVIAWRIFSWVGPLTAVVLAGAPLLLFAISRRLLPQTRQARLPKCSPTL